jgi:hypothetical protein
VQHVRRTTRSPAFVSEHDLHAKAACAHLHSAPQGYARQQKSEQRASSWASLIADASSYPRDKNPLIFFCSLRLWSAAARSSSGVCGATKNETAAVKWESEAQILCKPLKSCAPPTRLGPSWHLTAAALWLRPVAAGSPVSSAKVVSTAGTTFSGCFLDVPRVESRSMVLSGSLLADASPTSGGSLAADVAAILFPRLASAPLPLPPPPPLPP